MITAENHDRDIVEHQDGLRHRHLTGNQRGMEITHRHLPLTRDPRTHLPVRRRDEEVYDLSCAGHGRVVRIIHPHDEISPEPELVTCPNCIRRMKECRRTADGDWMMETSPLSGAKSN